MTESIHRRRLTHLVASHTERIVEQALADGVGVADLPGMKLRWYKIGETRAAGFEPEPGVDGEVGRVRTTTETNVYVYDSIGGSLGVTASQFARDLEEVDADVIHLRINSPGGSVNDAKAIMNTLRAHPARVISHVDGLAASAATVVLMAGDEIVMEPGGEAMVHFASTTADGDHTVIGAVTDWIKRQSEDIAELYAQHSGRTADEWMELMAAETWFYGHEAVEAGLADRAETLTRGEFDDPEVTERMRKRHFTGHFRYRNRVEAGAPNTAKRLTSAVGGGHASRSRRAGVTSEVRDAAKLRRHAASGGMVHRSAPAGVTTMARRSAPDGGIQRRSVEFRGREMVETDGFFTVYGRGYEMWDMYGPYVEEVVDGAGRQTIAGKPDTCFLINHTGIALARTGGPWNQNRGTLFLEEQDRGGWHRAYLNPENMHVQTLVQGMDGGIITEMSFAFMITEGVWNDDFTVFQIRAYDIDRGDVSAVNFGASPHTNITARAAELLDELEQLPAGAIVEASRRLAHRVDQYQRVLGEADPGRLARIVEPALAEVADSRGATAGVDPLLSDLATRYGDAFARIGDADLPPAQREPAEPDEDDNHQGENPPDVDNTTPGGSTVATFEALLKTL